jgi:hypothetical protein
MATTPFQLDPSLPFAAALNPGFLQAQEPGNPASNFAKIFEEQRLAYASDQFTNTFINGTDIAWNSSTEVQGLLSERWAIGEVVPGMTLEQWLLANPGPDAPWNWSYTDWGLVGGMPSKVTMIKVMDPKTGTVTMQIAVPPSAQGQ